MQSFNDSKSEGTRPSKKKKPDYGLDAPQSLLLLVLTGVAGAVGLVVERHFVSPSTTPFSYLTGLFMFLLVLGIVTSAELLWSSKSGKLRIRNRIIDSINWRGDEMILDVGCGRGLMLIAAAKKLSGKGKATGVDIWRAVDQSGNRPEKTLENANIEGVVDQIEIKTADARKLPFPDSSFDVVLSSLALHNIEGQMERKSAILEIVRVLKPDGRAAIFDIAMTKEYEQAFNESGVMKEVQRKREDFLFFTPCFLVSARKDRVE